MTKQHRKSGFTLVEILIVVIILGILAAIVIPQFTEASSEARESTLTSNLQVLRSQIGLYKIQHNDTYPDSTTSTTFENALTTKTLVTGVTDANGEFGPYMQKVPENPFVTGAGANTLFTFGTAANPSDNTSHWYFNTATGAISANDSYDGSDADTNPDHTDL